jgi:hypothetical protein
MNEERYHKAWEETKQDAIGQIRQIEENKFLDEFNALLKKYGVSIQVEVTHVEYPYNNVEAIINFQNKKYDNIASYKTNNIYLPE